MIINNSKIVKNKLKKAIFYQLIIIMLTGFLMPFNSVQAVDTTPLVLSNISINKTDKTATITWQTNRPTVGRIQYGLYSEDYHWTLNTNDKKTEHTMTISGLFPETDYFFKITASDDISEVTSFEQTFKTNKAGDNKTPTISDIRVPYTTGDTATIQWYTDEEATSEVDYGLTTNYSSHFSDGNRVRIHDITITGLIDGTQYHFSVKSKDKDNNVARWYDLTFQTKLTDKTDRDELIIYNVTPASENDINITETSAVISWRTNKLAKGWVRYGETISYGKTVATNPPRDFTQSVTLTGLKPGTVYYFEIQVKDALNKEIKSSGYSFKTKSNVSENNHYPETPGQILGASSCDVNLNTDFGYYGLYYNLSKDHPDVETWKNNVATAADNDWYNSQYFSFSRVDPNLEFGKNFFPIDENKPGDPFGFAVYWRAMIKADQDGFYHYKITSDDDSWVFIDGRLTSDLHGIHEAKTDNQDVGLPAGYHTLEIYFAERQSHGSDMLFTLDSRLKVYPLPEGCTIQDILDFNQLLGSGVGGGLILGDSTNNNYQLGYQKGYNNGLNDSSQGRSYDENRGNTGDNSDTYNNGYRNGYKDGYNKGMSAYACNPNLGYTKIKALYKTTDSPDIWTILETGQKHYITSPKSFNLYQCDWNKVKTVSRATLESYANANLVRTPDDPMIYYLFQRPEHKWLKRNIPSPTVFVSYPQNFWGNVARVNYLDINAYPDAQLIKAFDKPEVYLIEGNLKRHIASEKVFERLGYDWAEVVELSQIHLDSFEDGPAIN